MLKRAVSIILLIMIMIGVSGCMLKSTVKFMFKKRYTMTEKKEIALKYLKEKYDEDFEFVTISGVDWTLSLQKIYFFPKYGTTDDKFAVWFSPDDDGTYHISDGYFAILIKDEYEKVMNDFVKDLYKDYKLYLRFGTGIECPDRLNKDTKITEIYKEGELKPLRSETTILVKESSAEGIDTDESLIKIAVRMKEYKLMGMVTILIIKDEKFAEVDFANGPLNKGEDAIGGIEKDIRVNSKLEISEVAQWAY